MRHFINRITIKNDKEEVVSKIIEFGLFISYDHPKVIITDECKNEFAINKRNEAIEIFDDVDKESVLFKPVIFKEDSDQDDYASNRYWLDNSNNFKFPLYWPEKLFEGKTEGEYLEMDIFFKENTHSPITVRVNLAQQLAFEHKVFEEVLTHKELKRI